MGFFYGEETEDGFEPSTLHRLLKPAISGNTINGVGETEDRPATAVYHRFSKHPWRAIGISFVARNIWWDHVGSDSAKRTNKMKKREDAVVQPTEVLVEKPASRFTKELKEKALHHPYVDVCGIAENHENLYYKQDLPEIEHIPKYVFVIGYRMNYDKMATVLKKEKWWKKLPYKRKWRPAAETVMVNYWQTHEAAVELAEWIRSQGYYARGFGGAMGTKLNLLRSAIEAGIGELGKHGSILNDEFGSNLRFAAVVTDMPLIPDGQRDFGADEFCMSCQLCTTSCPPKAISDEKKMVRGHKKWSVDFDKCVPFFNETSGCTICITVCPWSRPGVAPNLTQKMLKKRNAREASGN